jgi:hypothetical protein
MKKNPCRMATYPLRKNDFFVDIDRPTIEENYFFKKYYRITNKELQNLLKEGYPLFFLQEINESNCKVFVYYFLGLATFIIENYTNKEYKFDIATIYAELAETLYNKLKCYKECNFYNDCIAFYLKWSIKNYRRMNINEEIYERVLLDYENTYSDIKKLMSKEQIKGCPVPPSQWKTPLKND